MQRWIPVLAIALVLQLALALTLGLRANPLAARQPDTPLVQVDLAGADRLLVAGPAPGEAGSAAQVELLKKDGVWTLPGYFDAPAGAAKVESLLERLSRVRRGFPVATTEEALKRFRVAADSYERHLVVSRDGQRLAGVYLGSSPGLRKSHARTEEDEAVYAVELAAYEMPERASDWLDPDLLKRDPETLAGLEVTWPGGDTFRLVRQGSDGDQPRPAWKAEGLPAGEALDPTRTEALVQAVAGLRVDGVLGTQTRPEWQQEQPVLGLSLRERDGQTRTWTLSKPKEGESHVIKASDRPWYLELKEWSARPLLDAAARDKLIVPDRLAAAAAPAEPAPATGEAHTGLAAQAEQASALAAEQSAMETGLPAGELQPQAVRADPASAPVASPPVPAEPPGQEVPLAAPEPRAPAE